MARVRRDLRWDVCSRCPNFSIGPPSACRKLSGSLVDRLASPAPFCPIGLHAALPVVQGVIAPPAPQRCRLKGWISAGLKVLLVLLRLCRAAPAAVAERRAACRGCVHRRRLSGWLDVCTKCGCMVRAKTALATEGCPIGAWKPEPGGCVVIDELECLGLVSPCRTGGCGR